MTVRRMDHVGIVVRDLAATTAFFEALGLVVEGEASLEGEWVDRVIGLSGVRSRIVMLRTPDGSAGFELSRFDAPPARDGDAAAPVNVTGLRHVSFLVEDLDAALDRLRPHGGEVLDSVVQYEDVYRLCYVRGPEGILVELAEELG